MHRVHRVDLCAALDEQRDNASGSVVGGDMQWVLVAPVGIFDVRGNA